MAKWGFQPLGDAVAIADAARDRRDWSSAERFYRRATEADPTAAPVWIQLGHALKEQRKFTEAEVAYTRATELDPISSDAFLQLGHLRKICRSGQLAEQDYARALELDPKSQEARRELLASGWSLRRLRFLTRGFRNTLADGAAPLVVELTDLVDFLQHSKYPTGIQRVQLELASVFDRVAEHVEFVFYHGGRSCWLPIEREQVRDLIALMRDPAGLSDDDRAAAAARIRQGVAAGEAFVFAPGSILANIGSSWGFINYFASLRVAQAQSGLRYAPFIHDCIPLLYPESCADVIIDFIQWLDGMLSHADFVFANSDNTRADLVKAAATLGVEAPECFTIHLNGRFHVVETEATLSEAVALFRNHALDFTDYVLFVSSIEPRKNHMLALSAWTRMLKARPKNEIPLLVCVGSNGWHNDSFYNTLSRSEELAKKVVVLNNVSDQCLKLLYERCLFTIYPSLYEGWGLPVSESLAHGKVPLISNCSSLPEAGGDQAVYFSLTSEAEFSEKLEKLIYDDAFRGEREARIAAGPHLRRWEDVAAQISSVACARSCGDAGQETSAPARAPSRRLTCGRYYSFARNAAKSLDDMVHNGDRFRDEGAWLAPEFWGCWISDGFGDIAFSLADQPGDDFLIYLHLTGTPNIDNDVTLRLASTVWSKKVRAPRDTAFWERLPLSFASDSLRELRIRLRPERIDDFAPATEGRDARRAGVGVKGVYVCGAADVSSRLALTEAIATGDLRPIARRFQRAPVL